ncbi:MAG: polysaccharide biosynthesis/export family protein [Fibrobacteria bacterium]|nr:polysaccharide biosynthesis/export family protein [Fibrobacteria bacterium]
MRFSSRAPASGLVDTSAVVGGVRIELQSLQASTINDLLRERRNKVAQPDTSLTNFVPGAYKLGPFDVLTVAVWEHPELTSPLGEYRSDIASGQTIDAEGRFFYPYAGLVEAKGLTVGEVREKLREALKPYLNAPQLDVKVSSFRSRKAFLYGAVSNPGPIALTETPTSLLEVLSQAGTTAGNGDLTRVELQRDGRVFIVDALQVDQTGSIASHIFLKQGDAIRVPSTDEEKVYVMGEVRSQTSVPLKSGRLSLVQALAEAGGLDLTTAQTKGVYVIRQQGDRVRVWHLDARSPLALAMADRFPLEARDLVFVDATNLVLWNRVVGLVLPTVQLYNAGVQGILDTKKVPE